MGILRIEKVSELRPHLITFPNLRWKYGTGVAISTGEGRYKKHSYRNGVMTELGDIEESLWYQLMSQLIQRNSEQWLLEALIEWEKEQCYRPLSLSEIRKEALHLHSVRIFDDPEWVDFLPFNRKFRPDILMQAHIVAIITECCGIRGEVTQEQINRAYDGTIHCPRCGRWSRFTLENGGNDEKGNYK